jgi:hypothetical protein
MKDLIGYDRIIENSMRRVIHETLKKVEKTGLPGSHYFVISFFTKASNVMIPENLLEKYPEEMTIILQNQYRALSVYENYFKIALSFAGNFENMTIPFDSISSFSDPSINFVLRFNFSLDEEEKSKKTITNTENHSAFLDSDKNPESNEKSEIDLSAKVISLDAFRKKYNPKTTK